MPSATTASGIGSASHARHRSRAVSAAEEVTRRATGRDGDRRDPKATAHSTSPDGTPPRPATSGAVTVESRNLDRGLAARLLRSDLQTLTRSARGISHEREDAEPRRDRPRRFKPRQGEMAMRVILAALGTVCALGALAADPPVAVAADVEIPPRNIQVGPRPYYLVDDMDP